MLEGPFQALSFSSAVAARLVFDRSLISSGFLFRCILVLCLLHMRTVRIFRIGIRNSPYFEIFLVGEGVRLRDCKGKECRMTAAQQDWNNGLA